MQMRKTHLAGRLARQSGVSKAEAADRLDRVVHQIISKLRKGHAASLPGLGEFIPGSSPGQTWIFKFENEKPDTNRLDDASRERSGDAGR